MLLGMPNRTRFVSCGHRGFGGFCHRCAQADKLEQEARAETRPAVQAQMRLEVQRLRGAKGASPSQAASAAALAPGSPAVVGTPEG